MTRSFAVLVVCHANTARSVMAEALLRRMLAERDLGERVRVDSAGIANWARDGMLPSLDARLVREEVSELAEGAGKSIFTLREFAGEQGDIADPASQGEETFRACRDEIRRCLERSIDRLVGQLPPAL